MRFRPLHPRLDGIVGRLRELPGDELLAGWLEALGRARSLGFFDELDGGDRACSYRDEAAIYRIEFARRKSENDC